MGNYLAAALAVAATVWGPLPCDLRVEWRAMGPLGWAAPNTCTLVLAHRRWRWPALCHVVVHEVGHLHGQGHSADPRNVMFPTYSPERVYWRCRKDR